MKTLTHLLRWFNTLEGCQANIVRPRVDFTFRGKSLGEFHIEKETIRFSDRSKSETMALGAIANRLEVLWLDARKESK